MERVFKIQHINDLFTVEFRKLVAEDCELVSDSGYLISMQEKYISRKIVYSVKKELIQEIKDFIFLIKEKKKKNHYLEFMAFDGKLFIKIEDKYLRDDFIKYIDLIANEIVLDKSKYLDFRGCKTEQDRDKKIEKLKKQIDLYESEKLSFLDAHLYYLNMEIEKLIRYINKETENELVNYITSGECIENISDEKLLDLSKESKKLSVELAVLSERRNIVNEELSNLKRQIVIDRLISNNFTITDEYGNKYALPESTTERVREKLNTSFIPKKHIKI
jgi:hypothetical protein